MGIGLIGVQYRVSIAFERERYCIRMAAENGGLR
jgi:hypothetical protein